MPNNGKSKRSFNTVRNSNREKRAQRQQRQRFLILCMAVVILLLILTLIVFGACSIAHSVKGHKGNEETTDQKDPPPITPPEVEYADITEPNSGVGSGELILVNSEHVYSGSTTGMINLESSDIVRDKINGHATYQYNTDGLHPVQIRDSAFKAFEAMLHKFYELEEDGSVRLKEAYRSLAAQEGKSVKPGYSDHHTGYLLAIDNYQGDDLPGDHWIYQNCYKYGFVIRYPSDKTSYTGISGYTTAIRFVGIPHATYMSTNNLCMEQYVELLANYTLEKPLEVTGADGNEYAIYYVKASSNVATELTTLKVPSNYQYTLSGDNVGGFIVTVNMNEPTVAAE